MNRNQTAIPRKNSFASVKSVNQTSWEPVAGWYDEMLAGNDTYQAKVILPNLLRLVPPKGKRIIDIACGQGFFSLAFAENGANVLGIDISKELIELARKHAPANLRFEVSSADKIVSAEDNNFDAALIVLALQNIKEMNGTLSEASRVLKNDGTLALVLNHPCFRIPKESAWGYDENKKVQYRRIDKYGRPFAVEIDMTPGVNQGVNQGASAKIYTKSFHRPLQDYFKALSASGFRVSGLEEWISHKQSSPGPRASAEDSARKEFPMFLAIVARKQG